MGLESIRGYGTAQHMQALADLGATPHHRADFKPIAEIIEQKKADSKQLLSMQIASFTFGLP